MFVALAGVVVSLLAGAWLAWRATQVRSHLESAASLTHGLQQQLRAADDAGSRSTVQEIGRHTRAARQATSDPLWRLAGSMPLVGDDDRAVAGIAAATDDVATSVLPAFVDLASRARTLRPVDGTVDVASIAALGTRLSAARATLGRLTADTAVLDRPGLVGSVREALQRLRRDLSDAQDKAVAAGGVLTLAPPMLGSTGPRTYLVAVQNLSEVRATGGIWAAWILLRADQGRLTIERQGSADDVNSRMRGVPLPPQLEALYGTRMGRYFQDVNLTPDFPTAAALARRLFAQAYGVSVDGVFALDSVTLSYLLAATGPIALDATTSLTSANAVETLQSSVYLHVREAAAQDAYFARAAREVFATLLVGRASSADLLSALGRASAEGRLLLWSASDDEQTLIRRTALAGDLAASAAQGFGVYLNDGTGAKMDYYLQPAVRLTCGTDGHVRVAVRLTSSAPTTPLPFSVDGNGRWGVPDGVTRTDVLLVAPRGASVARATADGRAVAIGTGVDSGAFVAVATVDVAAGASREIEFDIAAPSAGIDAAGIRTTPTIRTWLGTATFPTKC